MANQKPSGRDQTGPGLVERFFPADRRGLERHDVIREVMAALPGFADDERRAMFPLVFRKWLAAFCASHLADQDEATVVEMQTGVGKLRQTARAFNKALGALPQNADLWLGLYWPPHDLAPRDFKIHPRHLSERQRKPTRGDDSIINFPTTNLSHVDALAAESADCARAASAVLKRLCKPAVGRPREYAKKEIAYNLAEIYAWVTGTLPRRRVNPYAQYGGSEYGPFREFVGAVFQVIYGNTAGLDDAVRDAVKSMEENPQGTGLISTIIQAL